MYKTSFKISKMDCPCEVQMIKMKLAELQNIHSMEFSIDNRLLIVFHSGNYQQIFQHLKSLQLDTSLIDSSAADDYSKTNDTNERVLLWRVLYINFFFFILEMATGFLSGSMGLIADSLDMLADSLVYGLALLAVGTSIIYKKRIAKIAGYFQIFLAIIGLVEVIKRFIGSESIPHFQTMAFVSLLTLIGNALCLYLLQKNKSQEAHMQASMIFTSNDVIINIGVIIASGLVYLTNSKSPDLIIGAIVFCIVWQGAIKILKLSK